MRHITREFPHSPHRFILGFIFGLFLSVVFAGLSAPLPALAQSSWRSPASSPFAAAEFRKKAENKQNSRWTLSEWLAQKDRNRMMDLWLGMYKPSPYEFILNGSYDSYDLKLDSPPSRSTFNSGTGSIAFYALILGVEALHENNWHQGYQDVQGLVHLRVLGNSNQSTHLNLSYGTRKYSEGDIEINQQIAGAELDLYIEKHIGIHGLYRHYFPSEEPTWGVTEGRRIEVGAFLDISFIRIFGNWFEDSLKSKSDTQQTHRDRGGIQYGFKFFF